MLNPSSFQTALPIEDFSLRYANDLNGFAALKLFVPHYVSKSTGKYYVYNKDNFRVVDSIAPSGTEAKSTSWGVSTETYTLIERALKVPVLGRDARDFDRPVADLDQDAAMHLMDLLMIELEQAAYTKACTTSNYPSGSLTTLTGGTDTWLDAGGDPLENVRASRQACRELCGKFPNKMFMSGKTLDILKLNPVIIDRIKYTNGQSVTVDMLKGLFEVDEIVISNAMKNTALEGSADVMAEIWGDEVVLAVVDPNPRLRSMTYGKCFMGQRFYTKTIDAPELGRDLGAHYLESGWEWALEFTAQASDNDAVAATIIDNVY